jgi:hypothetical protein
VDDWIEQQLDKLLGVPAVRQGQGSGIISELEVG